jgi:hypothetical protein
MTDADARQPTDTGAGPHGAGPRVSVWGDRPAARGRLVTLLAAKAVVDLLFVCALAAGVHRAAFPPTFDGAVEQADAAVVRGWVVDESDPGRRVEVQLYLDGRPVAAAVTEGRAFTFELGPQPPGEHEARVYALHPSPDGRRRALRQIGDAAKFVVRQEGQ